MVQPSQLEGRRIKAPLIERLAGRGLATTFLLRLRFNRLGGHRVAVNLLARSSVTPDSARACSAETEPQSCAGRMVICSNREEMGKPRKPLANMEGLHQIARTIFQDRGLVLQECARVSQ